MSVTLFYGVSAMFDNQYVYDIDVCRIVTPMLKLCVFSKEGGLIPKQVKACLNLLEVDSPELFPCESALFDGCRFALAWRKMEKEKDFTTNNSSRGRDFDSCLAIDGTFGHHRAVPGVSRSC
nr:zinc finger, CCHC-type [Tanacetum cinerariifolium]